MTTYFDLDEDGELEIEDPEFGGMCLTEPEVRKLYQILKKHFERKWIKQPQKIRKEV
jgi:hypothetical protein